jgi:hypothetical protein
MRAQQHVKTKSCREPCLFLGLKKALLDGRQTILNLNKSQIVGGKASKFERDTGCGGDNLKFLSAQYNIREMKFSYLCDTRALLSSQAGVLVLCMRAASFSVRTFYLLSHSRLCSLFFCRKSVVVAPFPSRRNRIAFK